MIVVKVQLYSFGILNIMYIFEDFLDLFVKIITIGGYNGNI